MAASAHRGSDGRRRPGPGGVRAAGPGPRRAAPAGPDRGGLAASTGQPLVALWGHKWRIDAALELGSITAVEEPAAVSALVRSILARLGVADRTEIATATVLGDPASARHA